MRNKLTFNLFSAVSIHLTPSPPREPGSALPRATNTTLQASMKDGMAHAVMLGIGENFIGVFGIYLRASAAQIGILASLPPFIGSCTQLLAVWLLGFLRSRRSLLVAGAFANALLWIPIALVPTYFGLGPSAAIALIALVTLYHIAAALTGPPWNSIMGDVVPPKQRGAYFGRRSKFVGIASFVGFIAGGQLLHIFEIGGDEALGFLAIFGLAAIFRLASTYYLSRHEDPPHIPDPTAYFSLWQFIRRSPRSNFAKFVYFVAAMNGATFLSGPFVAVYLLRDLHLTYLQFTFFGALTAIVQFFTMQYWGTLSDLFGTKKILNVCAFLVAFNAILWVFSPAIPWLLFCQAFGAFSWAGFNLSASNFLFDAVTPQKRARCAAYQALVTGFAVLCGSYLGGVLVPYLPTHVEFVGVDIVLSSPLLSLFVLSSLVRLALAVLLLPAFREVREVTPIEHHELVLHVVGIRPLMGYTLDVVTGLHSRARKVGKRWWGNRK